MSEVYKSSDIRPIKVQFEGEEKEYIFKNVIMNGILKDNNEEVLSLIGGYTDINDFMVAYVNFIIECYNFLLENYENEEVGFTKMSVLEIVRKYTNEIFDDMENGIISETKEETE
jgi:hypothetical protein